ncbi:MAG: hypothetical protein KDK51_01720 [Deltaproteobacteria bacterium]|nr:hypothetical protein [Deltaproteobacteria bacterium]
MNACVFVLQPRSFFSQIRHQWALQQQTKHIHVSMDEIYTTEPARILQNQLQLHFWTHQTYPENLDQFYFASDQQNWIYNPAIKNYDLYKATP